MCKEMYREIQGPLHPASPNVNILYNWSTVSNRKLTFVQSIEVIQILPVIHVLMCAYVYVSMFE